MLISSAIVFFLLFSAHAGAVSEEPLLLSDDLAGSLIRTDRATHKTGAITFDARTRPLRGHRLQETELERACADPALLYAGTSVTGSCDCEDAFTGNGTDTVLIQCTLTGDFQCGEGVCTNQLDIWVFSTTTGELTARGTCFRCADSDARCATYQDTCYMAQFGAGDEIATCFLLRLDAPEDDAVCRACVPCESSGGTPGLDYTCFGGEDASDGCRTESRLGWHPFSAAATATPSPTTSPTLRPTSQSPTTQYPTASPTRVETAFPTRMRVTESPGSTRGDNLNQEDDDGDNGGGNAILLGILVGAGVLLIVVMAVLVYCLCVADKRNGNDSPAAAPQQQKAPPQSTLTGPPPSGHPYPVKPPPPSPPYTGQPQYAPKPPPYDVAQNPHYNNVARVQQPEPFAPHAYPSFPHGAAAGAAPHTPWDRFRGSSSRDAAAASSGSQGTHPTYSGSHQSSSGGGDAYQARDLPSNLDYKDQGREFASVMEVDAVPVPDRLVYNRDCHGTDC